MTHHTASLPQPKLDQAAGILHALAHPLRIKIVDYLVAANGVTVLDMQDGLGMEASMLSNHLRVLRQSGIVDTTRDGKYISYQLGAKRLRQIQVAVKTFADQVEEVIA